jgi:hypothetical protein
MVQTGLYISLSSMSQSLELRHVANYQTNAHSDLISLHVSEPVLQFAALLDK